MIHFLMRVMALFVAAGLCSAAPFTVIPAPAGLPGATIGYGYELVNDSPDLYFAPSAFSSPTFPFATSVDLFDYPVLAPGETLTLPYNGTEGLLELILDAGASPGVFTGEYLLFGDFYAGDPIADPTLPVVSSVQLTAEIVVNVQDPNTVVPEPSSMAFLGASLVMFFGLACRRTWIR